MVGMHAYKEKTTDDKTEELTCWAHSKAKGRLVYTDRKVGTRTDERVLMLETQACTNREVGIWTDE